MITRTNCYYCGSASLEKLFDVAAYIRSEKTAADLVRCRSCSLVFLNPQLTPDELKRFYPEEYYAPPEDAIRQQMPSFMLFNKIKTTLHFKKTGKLLDIGCGGGGFIRQMQERGWDASGLDFSEIACRLAREKVGAANVIQGDLFSASLPVRYYDVVTLWHVFEHLDDPLRALRRIRALLKDDGQLIICCPNFRSWLRVFFKARWYPLCVPHHLFHFTSQTLARLLEAGGYKIIGEKKHFVDPLTNMGSLKLSLLRLLGLGKITGADDVTGAGAAVTPERSLAWRLSRSFFNVSCVAGSVVLSLLGNEELLLVWARKDTEFNAGSGHE